MRFAGRGVSNAERSSIAGVYPLLGDSLLDNGDSLEFVSYSLLADPRERMRRHSVLAVGGRERIAAGRRDVVAGEVECPLQLAPTPLGLLLKIFEL